LVIFLTGCRGAYIALFVILLGIVFASYQMIFTDFNSEKLKTFWKGTLGVCSLGCIGFLALNHGILHRIMSIFILRGDSSTSFRMNVYNSAIQMFQDNWLCGIGVGNKVFREIYGLYMLSGFDALSCYCVFLEMAVESGILSLIAYLMFLGSLLFAGYRNFIKSKDYNYKVLLFITSISIVAVMFHGLVDTVYFRPQIQYLFWTMAAILTVLVRKDKVTE
jgi:putative inorganic carbon (HCO3(-)) transporter